MLPWPGPGRSGVRSKPAVPAAFRPDCLARTAHIRQPALGSWRGDWALCLAAAILSICCSGEGIVDSSSPDASCFTDPTLAFDPKLSCIQEMVFTPRCAKPSCHINPGAAQGMDLSEGQAFASTVGKLTLSDPNFLRVDPGDPTNSYVIMKLLGDPRIVGSRMPADAPPFLTQGEIDPISAWIALGAGDN